MQQAPAKRSAFDVGMLVGGAVYLLFVAARHAIVGPPPGLLIMGYLYTAIPAVVIGGGIAAVGNVIQLRFGTRVKSMVAAAFVLSMIVLPGFVFYEHIRYLLRVSGILGVALVCGCACVNSRPAKTISAALFFTACIACSIAAACVPPPAFPDPPVEMKPPTYIALMREYDFHNWESKQGHPILLTWPVVDSRDAGSELHPD